MGAWIVRLPKHRAMIGGERPVVILHVAEDGRETELEVLSVHSSLPPYLGDIIKTQVAKGRQNLILDLSFIRSFHGMGSVDIGEIVAAFTKVRDLGGSLVLAGLSPKDQNTFRETRLDSVLPIFPSVSQAAEHYYTATATTPADGGGAGRGELVRAG